MKNEIRKKRIIVFTLDPINPVIKLLLHEFRKSWNVIVISSNELSTDYEFNWKKYSHKYSIFERFCLFFYKHIKSRAEIKFTERNIYRKFQKFINLLFYIKNIVPLPYYSSICELIYSKSSKDKKFFQKDDIIFIDANLKHLEALIPLIVVAKKQSERVYSYVASWDNTQYSTLNTFSDLYFVWNKINKDELNIFYKIPKEKIKIVGSLNHDYIVNLNPPVLNKINNIINTKNTKIKLLYAAAFPETDEVFSSLELEFIEWLAIRISELNSNITIVFRPYPSILRKKFKNKLQHIKNIQIDDSSKYVNTQRLGNKEMYSYNEDPVGKFNFFNTVDCLLSIGSTYTLEFAFSDSKIFQIDFSKFKCPDNIKPLFDRLAIYGHLDVLFDQRFKSNFICSVEYLVNCLSKIEDFEFYEYNNYLRSIAKPYGMVNTAKIIHENIISNEALYS